MNGWSDLSSLYLYSRERQVLVGSKVPSFDIKQAKKTSETIGEYPDSIIIFFSRYEIHCYRWNMRATCER